MTNTELIDYVFKSSDVAKKDVEVVFKQLVKGMQSTLKKGGAVSVSGIGIFSVRVRKARVGTNPRTQAVINIAEKKVLNLHAAGVVNDLLNGR